MTTQRVQIADALRQRFLSASHLGLLEPGAKLPSVRELAAEFDVDRRVVSAAYHLLEREGLVQLRKRSGIYFAPPHETRVTTPNADWVVDVLLQGSARGVPAPALPERLRRCVDTLRLRAACIECNDDQVDALCDELRADYGFETSGVDVDTLLAAGSLPEVERADLLVTTPFHVGEVKEVAEKLGKPWVAVSFRADVFAAVARLLPAGPVYFVVTDTRFATKLRAIFAAFQSAANLHPLIEGIDDLSRIPSTAPTYVTRAARRRLTDAGLLARFIPESRVFSPDSARELLTFVVRANMEAVANRNAQP